MASYHIIVSDEIDQELRVVFGKTTLPKDLTQPNILTPATDEDIENEIKDYLKFRIASARAAKVHAKAMEEEL